MTSHVLVANVRLLIDYFYSSMEAQSYQLRIFIGVFAEFMALGTMMCAWSCVPTATVMHDCWWATYGPGYHPHEDDTYRMWPTKA